jgi:superfamily II DNA/RNA helicase
MAKVCSDSVVTCDNLVAVESDRLKENQWSLRKHTNIGMEVMDKVEFVVSKAVWSDNGIEMVTLPNPIDNFEKAFHAYPDILASVKQRGLTHPSVLQSQAWPILLDGFNMIAVVGMRKAKDRLLSYLLPALVCIRGNVAKYVESSVKVFIVAATFDIAIEMEREARSFCGEYVSVGVWGSEQDISSNKIAVDCKPDILICIPENIQLLIKENGVNIRDVRCVILDQADSMLEGGYEQNIAMLLTNTAGRKQTVITTTTWSRTIFSWVDVHVHDPYIVCVGDC